MINALSPYYLNYTDTNLTLVKVDLYIYTGTQTTDRGAIKYSIEKKPYNQLVSIEVSSLVKDYLTTDLTTQAVWVDIITTKYISDVAQSPTIEQHAAFYGYGYFEDGINPQQSNNIMISNDIILNYLGSDVKIPVNATQNSTVEYYNGNTLISTVTITPTTLSDNIINYTTSGLTYNRVLINGKEIKIKDIDECTDTPHKVTFINKFGALQDLWFFKKTSKNISIKKEKFKRNTINQGNYSISKHQNKEIKSEGIESLTINSGYYPESYNEVFKELFLSELIWINYNNQVRPINIKTSNLKFKNQLTDKLIDYTIEIEFSNNKINNIV